LLNVTWYVPLIYGPFFLPHTVYVEPAPETKDESNKITKSWRYQRGDKSRKSTKDRWYNGLKKTKRQRDNNGKKNTTADWAAYYSGMYLL
jgi:hypothetical protein